MSNKDTQVIDILISNKVKYTKYLVKVFMGYGGYVIVSAVKATMIIYDADQHRREVDVTTLNTEDTYEALVLSKASK